MKTCSLLLLLLVLVSCASSPLQLDGVDHTLPPSSVSAERPYTGKRVVWGGMLIKADPLKDITQLEVLAFPVNAYGEPDRQAASLGRFLIRHHGFLDPAQYASGRWLSVVGVIGQAQVGKVGEADYRFPVIQSEQLHLWTESNYTEPRTQFHFGIGIQL